MNRQLSPSAVIDEAWAIWASRLPPATSRGRPPTWRRRKSITASFSMWRSEVPGGGFRRMFPLGRQSITLSASGVSTDSGKGCTPRCERRCACRPELESPLCASAETQGEPGSFPRSRGSMGPDQASCNIFVKRSWDTVSKASAYSRRIR